MALSIVRLGVIANDDLNAVQSRLETIAYAVEPNWNQIEQRFVPQSTSGRSADVRVVWSASDNANGADEFSLRVSGPGIRGAHTALVRSIAIGTVSSNYTDLLAYLDYHPEQLMTLDGTLFRIRDNIIVKLVKCSEEPPGSSGWICEVATRSTEADVQSSQAACAAVVKSIQQTCPGAFFM